jgi:glutathione S-transferase
MIILYAAGPGFGLPEVSPYVEKTEIQLKLAGLAYRKQAGDPELSPKGQLPWIDDAGTLVADSTFIRKHLERKYGLDFDEGLDGVARAQAWAIERMLENHFGWTTAHARWLIPTNFEKGSARWFDEASEAARAQLRSQIVGEVAADLRAVGIGRHCPDEIVELGTRSLSALSTLLDRKPYLMGERPCGLDATAFGLLAGLLTPFFDSPLRRRAGGFANLVAYVDRMMAQFHPEHPWVSSAGKSMRRPAMA